MKIKKRTLVKFFLVLVGVGLVAGFVAWSGVGDLKKAFATAGWNLGWVVLFHFLPVAVEMVGWWSLFPPPERPNLLWMFLSRWVGESINNTLPVAQVGGDVVRARLAMRGGASASQSGAATVVDYTFGLLTLLIVGLVALEMLATRRGWGGWMGWLLLGVFVLAILLIGFLIAQATGKMFGKVRNIIKIILQKISTRALHALPGGAHHFDERLMNLYRDHWGRLAADALCRSASWVVGSVEILLALMFLGASAHSLEDAFILHALSMLVRSVAFFLPGGFGAQEGSFVLVGELLGMSQSTALALALIRRAREILLGLPGLVAWWLMEREFGSSEKESKASEKEPESAKQSQASEENDINRG